MRYMKATMLVLITLILLSSLAQADPHSIGKLEIVSTGQALSYDENKQHSIKFWLQQLMLSALYRDTVQSSSMDEWKQRLSVQTRIHCIYPTTATLAIPERRTLVFDEALVPLTADYQDYVFIRRGDSVLRLAKFDPWVFHKLVSETGVSVGAAEWAVERGLF